MNLVENEYHFLLVCPKYANLRKEHLTNYYCRWPTVEKFKNLMSSKSRNALINSSKIYIDPKEKETQGKI